MCFKIESSGVSTINNQLKLGNVGNLTVGDSVLQVKVLQSFSTNGTLCREFSSQPRWCSHIFDWCSLYMFYSTHVTLCEVEICRPPIVRFKE